MEKLSNQTQNLEKVKKIKFIFFKQLDAYFSMIIESFTPKFKVKLGVNFTFYSDIFFTAFSSC